MSDNEQFDKLPPAEQKALRMYVEQLNKWGKEQEGDSAWIFTLDQFFSENWQETYHIQTIPTGWFDIYIMSAGTGDDGGAARLIIWATADGFPAGDPENPHIEAIAQEFDTMVQMLYNSQEVK